VNELDEMLLRIDQDEALMGAFDEQRPVLFSYFEDALAALCEGGLDLDDRRMALAYDELRCNKSVAEADYVFRIGLLIGRRLTRGSKIDYDEIARTAAASVDERLGLGLDARMAAP
jgi:hypothetical protein